ncbi:MAG: outer membrane lipoprotein-sorting protein [bacterium]
MKSLLRSLTILCVLAALVSMAVAQTLDEVLEKNYAAKGGLEKIKSILSAESKGKVSVMGMELPISLKQKRGNKLRIESDFQGMTIVQAYDGQKAWMVMPMTGSTEPQDAPEEMAEGFEDQADMDGHLVDWKEKGYTLDLIGKEDVEGTEAYHVKVTTKKGKIRDYYIDAKTNLEMKVKAKVSRQGQELEVESIFGNYKPVNGVMMAFSVEQRAMGQIQSQISIDTVLVNVEIPDSLFTKPGEKK